MEAADVIDVGRDALIITLVISSPIMLIGLIVGLIISLFQALTHIQEMTLVFVPKILVVFASLFVLLPFMLATLLTFTQGLVDRMISLG
ncbi:MAG: flagellar biosynthesis protein FliQ [Alphaproteobacteria bacterium]|nr:flagellar biosynthesis protein FliQ [Alphaproteobacteria bacterium]MBU0797040.1 flagellar biosynthesis protein FliQ [Alphaproteobacteria bacterium]MBU0886554.1 flagellar biosynthesis protein FliQ [Alphaproteobacteria bacterium]MBU1814142.1 flagellar biosynthesis protein FliQ [Alphaproteobacteria bacterium]MBU2089968.1 flagellar biosynthesis protein FliQ [Alphaproteobacteria bacterium]